MKGTNDHDSEVHSEVKDGENFGFRKSKDNDTTKFGEGNSLQEETLALVP